MSLSEFALFSVAVAVSTLFVSFVAISVVLCCCFKAMLLDGILPQLVTGPLQCHSSAILL